MSLDDKLSDPRLVKLTFDGLETIYLASERVVERGNNFSDADRKQAYTFLREYDRCVMLEKPSVDLRQSFAHISNIVVRKAKTPSHELLNLVAWSCGGAAVYSSLRWLYGGNTEADAKLWTMSAIIGAAGTVAASILRNYLDNREQLNLRRISGLVCDSTDSIWEEALSQLHEKKYEAYK